MAKIDYTKGESPAEVLKRFMSEQDGGWSVYDLSEKTHGELSSGTINAILESKRTIDTDISKALSVAFKTPKKFFLDVQKEYDKASKKAK